MSKRTVFKMLESAAERYADKPYLSTKGDQGWIRTSFSEAEKKARTLAYAFVEIGLKKGDKLAILSEAKTDWIVTEFAALFAGGISVPLSIKLLPEEVPFRVNHSDSVLFAVSENTLDKVISQWDKYENKDLKLIVLDKPSDKIKSICQQHDFDSRQLLFINDLYRLGEANLEEHRAKVEELEQNTQEEIPVHPAAEIFPEMGPEERTALKDNVDRVGQCCP